MSYTYTLYNAQQGYKVFLDIWQMLKALLTSGQRMQVVVRKEKRSNAQNSKMWAMLTEVSQQVEWHGQRLEPEEWKDFFTAALKRQKVIPGMDGGFVVLGSSTRLMEKAEMSDLIELMYAFGADKGVVFNGS